MKVLVGQHELKIDKKDKVNQNEYKVTKCEFEFDEAITNDLVKIALFTNSAGTYKQYIVNNECDIPAEILEKQETTTLGVYAYKEENGELELRYSPEEIKFYVSNGSYKANAQNTEPITPTDKEQMESQISQNTSDISDLQANKQDKLTVGDNITIDENNVISAVDTIYDDTEIKADIQELQETKVDKDVNNLTYYTLTTETGSKITLSIDSSTYVMTLKLKDKNNNDISTANVDLPLETMVVGARYDSATKEIVLILKNGQEVRFSVADLVSGLQTEITENNKLSSDLVDDTNNTNKFVSASEKAQITTNKNDITAIKDGEEIDSFSDVENAFADVETALNLKEDKSNKVTEINSSSTDTQYPSAKCVYDSQEEQNEQIAELEMLYNAFPTVSAENETIQLDNTAKVKFREIDLKGNTSQVVIPEEQGTSVSNTSIYVSDVNTDKENTIELSGNTYQETTTGKNLLPIRNISKTINGIAFTINNDGTITANGTATEQIIYPINSNTTSTSANIPVQASTYKTILCGDNVTANSTYFLQTKYKINGTIRYHDSSSNVNLTINEAQNIGASLIVRQGQTLTNLILKPMLILSTETDSWEKFTNGPSPNPDYPQNIEVVTGENNITICGKNIFNEETEIGGWNFTEGEQLTKATTNHQLRCTNKIRVAPNTNYIFSVNGNAVTETVRFIFADKNNIILSSTTNSNGTILTPNNCEYLVFHSSAFKTTYGSTLPNPMIENGTTITTYEQYQETTYPVNLGNIELCKIDTYQDRIYKQNDKWYLEKNVGKVVLNGSESWNYYSTADGNLFRTTFSQMLSGDKLVRALCDNFKSVAKANRTNNTLSGDGQLLDFIYNDCSSASAWKNWLSTHNTILYYVLNTTTTTEITDTALVNQLNALYNATIYPTTNINTDTSNLLPYIDLHYNFVTPSPSPSRPSVVNVVKGNNTITISNSDNTESQNYPINLGDMELCKINTYQDYIYENNGNWFKKGNIGKVTLNGSEDWTLQSINNYGIANFATKINNAIHLSYGRARTNYFITQSTTIGNTSTEGFFFNQENTFHIRINSNKASTVTELKSWLSTHNTIVYYVLETPTITEITDTTLIEQLDNLENAYSYDTQTNITQTNDDKAFIINAEAILSLKNILN